MWDSIEELIETGKRITGPSSESPVTWIHAFGEAFLFVNGVHLTGESRERWTVKDADERAVKNTARIASKGHDCFSEENETVASDGDEMWSYCRVCGDTISVS